jgi:Ricin-type beta-trefoil lectin domain
MGATECLDVYNNQTTPGTKVELGPCNGGANQKWTLESNGTIVGQQSGLCLDVTGASTTEGTALEIWTCNGQSNQQWSCLPLIITRTPIGFPSPGITMT